MMTVNVEVASIFGAYIMAIFSALLLRELLAKPRTANISQTSISNGTYTSSKSTFQPIYRFCRWIVAFMNSMGIPVRPAVINFTS